MTLHSLPDVLSFCGFVALIVLFFWSLAWVYGDAENRGKSGCLITLLVFFIAWPFGLLIWACARPEIEGSSAARRKSSLKQGGIALFVIAFVGAGLFFASLWLDTIYMRKATPPASMKTLADFQAWKGKELISTGTYTDKETGQVFKVMLAPAGRFMASGPSVYLFDRNDRFFDWMPDSGDLHTEKNGYDLSGGIPRQTP